MNLTRYIGHLQSLSIARVHLNTTRQERGEVQEENILALIQEAEYQSQCHSLKCCQYHKGSDKQGCMILHTTKLLGKNILVNLELTHFSGTDRMKEW